MTNNEQMTKERIGALSIFLCVAAVPLGCSDGSSVNIGNTETVGSQLADYAAVWEGYAQAYAFSDGSDRLHLTIDSSGHGFMRVGDSAPPPAPSDASVGYPPGYMGMFSTGVGPSPPIPGFAYPLHAAQVQSNRIQLGIDFQELYSAWCAIEPSFAHTSDINATGAYGCLPEAKQIDHTHPLDAVCDVHFVDGTTQPMDCGKVSLCMLEVACSCTASGCSATLVRDGTPPEQYSVEIDGALDAAGSTLTGTFLVGRGDRVTVILRKQGG